MHKIPPFWVVGDTRFTRGYRPAEQASVILATRNYGARAAYVEFFIAAELLTYSKVDTKQLLDVITAKLIKQLDDFIEDERRTDENLAD